MEDINNVFKAYYGKKIAIYGISTETEKFLPQIMLCFDCCGLLDGFKTAGSIYGQPIISFEKAVEECVELIIVIARPGSCKAIEKRIGNACRENNIALFDIRGNDLLQKKNIVFDFKAVKGYTYEEVIVAIRNVDVVSFDLFDTLVIRNTMTSEDIIDIMSTWLKEQGIGIDDFVEKRIAAEKQLSQTTAPRLEEIYDNIIPDKYPLTSNQLAIKEYEIDRDTIEARVDVVNLLYEAKRLGKRIYITTDTYYSLDQIREILAQNGINDYDDVLVSCEYKTGKTQKLFDELIYKVNTNSILHVGDDIVSDIQSATSHHLDSIQLYSGAALFDFLGGLGMNEHVKTLSDRIKVGMFIANLFNSPFQFEENDNKIKVTDVFDVGYLFCAPMIEDFVIWFRDQVIQNHYSNIWFGARDGFLIKKIYEKQYMNPESVYFMTSRIAAIRAGVESEKDIIYVDSMKYSGKIEDNLSCRFGIDTVDIPDNEIDLSREGLLRYRDYILKNAIIKRSNYKKYIASLNTAEGDIVFFDFVAKGTSQMYIQRLVSNQIVGLYFLQLEQDFMKEKNLHITPFYTEDEKDNSAIFENYYILETFLTSPDPSVNEFNQDGLPVFANETRSEKDINCIMKAQNGVLSYVERYIKICPISERNINKKLDETFLMMIHKVKIKDKDFLNLVIEDPFFNRMTDLNCVL